MVPLQQMILNGIALDLLLKQEIQFIASKDLHLPVFQRMILATEQIEEIIKLGCKILPVKYTFDNHYWCDSIFHTKLITGESVLEG